MVINDLASALSTLTELRRDAMKRGKCGDSFHRNVLRPKEAEIEKQAPGFIVLWHQEFKAYGLFLREH